MVSGDREGYFNVFVRDDTVLTAYYQYKLADSSILDVGSNSQPTIADWNGDGRKDLILGTETGYVRFYENITSDSWPMFLDFTNLQAAGADIYLYRVNPYVFDLDGDGVRDLICGANDGYVRYYRNTGTNAEPFLVAEETLRTTAGVPIVPGGTYYYGSRCGFGYWNGDPWPDFLISGYDGLVELYLGQPFIGAGEGPARPNRQELRVAPVPGRATVMVSGLPAEVVSLFIYDAAGRPVRNLRHPGPAFVWNGTDDSGRRVAAGVYYCHSGGASVRVLLAD
ncbi:MAG: FG-GAP-like repeat-containing protein [candidate division WOR-3 bacterium]